MDSCSYRLGYLKDFFQQESGCFPQEASIHLVKRCTMGCFGVDFGAGLGLVFAGFGATFGVIWGGFLEDFEGIWGAFLR